MEWLFDWSLYINDHAHIPILFMFHASNDKVNSYIESLYIVHNRLVCYLIPLLLQVRVPRRYLLWLRPCLLLALSTPPSVSSLPLAPSPTPSLICSIVTNPWLTKKGWLLAAQPRRHSATPWPKSRGNARKPSVSSYRYTQKRLNAHVKFVNFRTT